METRSNSAKQLTLMCLFATACTVVFLKMNHQPNPETTSTDLPRRKEEIAAKAGALRPSGRQPVATPTSSLQGEGSPSQAAEAMVAKWEPRLKERWQKSHKALLSEQEKQELSRDLTQQETIQAAAQFLEAQVPHPSQPEGGRARLAALDILKGALEKAEGQAHEEAISAAETLISKDWKGHFAGKDPDGFSLQWAMGDQIELIHALRQSAPERLRALQDDSAHPEGQRIIHFALHSHL